MNIDILNSFDKLILLTRRDSTNQNIGKSNKTPHSCGFLFVQFPYPHLVFVYFDFYKKKKPAATGLSCAASDELNKIEEVFKFSSILSGVFR